MFKRILPCTLSIGFILFITFSGIISATCSQTDFNSSKIVKQDKITAQLLKTYRRNKHTSIFEEQTLPRGIFPPEKMNTKGNSNGSVSLGENYIRFDTNSAQPTPDSIRQIDEIAQAFASPELKEFNFIIFGHTDDRGSMEYNQRLSMQRATNIKNYIVATSLVRADRIIPIGRGEQEPLDEANNEKAWATNRRVELKVVPKTEARVVYKKQSETLKRELKSGEILQSGDQIAFYYSSYSKDSRYAYILSIDSSNKCTIVFSSGESGSGNDFKLGQQYRIPRNKEQWFSLDGTIGVENFYFVASSNPIDPAALKSEIQEFYYRSRDGSGKKLWQRGIADIENQANIIETQRQASLKMKYSYFKHIYFKHD